jgi:hypothetical protein
MAQRHTVEMLLLPDDSPRDLAAREQLAAVLPGAEVTDHWRPRSGRPSS